MRHKKAILLSLVGIFSASCMDHHEANVISKRYIHRYGYDVAEREWNSENYPGQVITTKKNGQTIAETYEDGILHGNKTTSYPHSQSVQSVEKYHRGILKSIITYNIKGYPETQKDILSPTHYFTSAWYPSGSPKVKEEFREEVLINGEYFNLTNQKDSFVKNGTGEKCIRNQVGDLLAKEIYSNYDIIYKETFHPNKSTASTAEYKNKELHGTKKSFAITGEPICVENFYHNKKDGQSTYYQNGSKYLEVTFKNNLKDGPERHYVDGQEVIQEIYWKEGRKHGENIIFCDGAPKTSWYYDDTKVSKKQFVELSQQTEYFTAMQ